jgi:FkbM family methyltransferase
MVGNTLVQLVIPSMRTPLGIILAAALSRYLGVSGFGQYALVFAYVATFSGVLSDWGLGSICLREMSRAPEDRASLVAGAASLQALIAVGSYLTMLTSLLVLRYPPAVSISIALYGVTILLSPLDVLALPFQADLHLSRLLPPSVLGTIMNFSLILAAILLRAPLIVIVAASLVSLLVQYAWTTGLSLKTLGVPIRPTRARWKSMLRETWPLSLSTLASTVLQQAPVLALSLVNLSAVGLFNAANKIPQQLFMLPLAVRATIFPLLSASWVADRRRFARQLERLTVASLLVSVPGAVLGIGLAEPLMHLLFGPAFAGAALPFALLVSVFPVMFMGILLGEALIAAGLQRINLTILTASVPLLLLLLVVLVPSGRATGAASAVLGCYIAIVGSALVVGARHLEVRTPLRALPWATTAMLCGILTLSLTKELGSILSAMVAGMVAFVVLGLSQIETVRGLASVFGFAIVGGTLRPRLGIGRRVRKFRHRLRLEPIRKADYLGHPFLYPADSLIGQSIAKGLKWDEPIRPVAMQLLPEDPTVCEVGSNIGAGLLQILAARPRARVIAVEPSERFRPLLERNLQSAGFRHVEIVPLLVGRINGRAWLHNNGSSASVVFAEYDGHEPRGMQLTEMTTLDHILQDRGPVHLIKVDTDGFDFEVLRGAVKLLTRHQPILFFELAVHLLSSPEADLAWLMSLGYRRLMCFTPSPAARLVGTTKDPDQAINWAKAFGYCDVLVSSEALLPQVRLEEIMAGFPQEHKRNGL